VIQTPSNNLVLNIKNIYEFCNIRAIDERPFLFEGPPTHAPPWEVLVLGNGFVVVCHGQAQPQRGHRVAAVAGRGLLMTSGALSFLNRVSALIHIVVL
jgi:hypothetical protein